MILRFIIAFVLIALVGGGLIGFNMFRDQAIEQFFATMPTPTVTVSTTTVEPITWKPSIEAIGTVSAANGVDLTVETTGVVKEILFDSNSKVATGDVLLRLDDEMQRADLAAAQTQAEHDRQSLERARELQRRGVGSQSNLDQAEAAAAASSAQVEKLEAVLRQKQLIAPFSGTIGIPRIEIGEYLAPGTVVATLQDLDNMRVNFTVPEQRFEELKIGQLVRVGSTAGEMPFTGSIIGIDPKIDPSTRLISVQAKIENSQGRLVPGQFVHVHVELPVEEDVIAVPQTALVTSLYGDYVFRLQPSDADGNSTGPEAAAPATQDTAEEVETVTESGDSDAVSIVEQVFVQAGRRSDGLVEILQGLSAGDLVVNAGQNRLTNGGRATIDNSVSPMQLSGAAR